MEGEVAKVSRGLAEVVEVFYGDPWGVERGRGNEEVREW